MNDRRAQRFVDMHERRLRKAMRMAQWYQQAGPD